MRSLRKEDAEWRECPLEGASAVSLWALLDGFRTTGNTHEVLKNAVLVDSSWLEDTE